MNTVVLEVRSLTDTLADAAQAGTGQVMGYKGKGYHSKA